MATAAPPLSSAGLVEGFKPSRGVNVSIVRPKSSSGGNGWGNASGASSNRATASSLLPMHDEVEFQGIQTMYPNAHRGSVPAGNVYPIVLSAQYSHKEHLFIHALTLWRITMASMLVVFVPTECGDRLCSMDEKVFATVFHTIVFAFNCVMLMLHLFAFFFKNTCAVTCGDVWHRRFEIFVAAYIVFNFSITVLLLFKDSNFSMSTITGLINASILYSGIKRTFVKLIDENVTQATQVQAQTSNQSSASAAAVFETNEDEMTVFVARHGGMVMNLKRSGVDENGKPRYRVRNDSLV